MRYGPNNSMKPITAPHIRFRNKITEDVNGCWIWGGYISPKGYGTFSPGSESDKKMVLAHRWSYEHHVGRIPEELMLDHLCRNRACVNPDHLEPVTNQENCIRGDTGKHLKERPKQTHCRKGHELFGGPCLVCAQARYTSWYQRTKSVRLPIYNEKRRNKRAEKRQQQKGRVTENV